ncbi:MAG: FHA domain-containing protein, partial [Cyanobacteria bacterium]|nr:FHA domain-containing protein [Cyanobacteriota bacterium]
MTAEKQMELAGYLVVNSGTPDAYFFELEHGKVLEIGRKPGSPTGPRKLVLPVPEVSSLHAELRPGTDGWCVRDNSSTNGTRLNGNWLSAGQDYLLKNGDHIKIAQVDLIVNLPESAPQRGDGASCCVFPLKVAARCPRRQKASLWNKESVMFTKQQNQHFETADGSPKRSLIMARLAGIVVMAAVSMILASSAAVHGQDLYI